MRQTDRCTAIFAYMLVTEFRHVMHCAHSHRSNQCSSFEHAGALLAREVYTCMTAASRSVLSTIDVVYWYLTPFCMQGRFSGRLQSKADEAGLLVECPQLGPLLGGSLDPKVCKGPVCAVLQNFITTWCDGINWHEASSQAGASSALTTGHACFFAYTCLCCCILLVSPCASQRICFGLAGLWPRRSAGLAVRHCPRHGQWACTPLPRGTGSILGGNCIPF